MNYTKGDIMRANYVGVVLLLVLVNFAFAECSTSCFLHIYVRDPADGYHKYDTLICFSGRAVTTSGSMTCPTITGYDGYACTSSGDVQRRTLEDNVSCCESSMVGQAAVGNTTGDPATVQKYRLCTNGGGGS